MAAKLATQSPFIPSPLRKAEPTWGNEPARNDLFSGRLSSGVTSQKTFTATAQVAPHCKQTQRNRHTILSSQNRTKTLGSSRTSKIHNLYIPL